MVDFHSASDTNKNVYTLILLDSVLNTCFPDHQLIVCWELRTEVWVFHENIVSKLTAGPALPHDDNQTKSRDFKTFDVFCPVEFLSGIEY